MSRPSILMLDEPSVGIAAGLKDMLFSAVKAISNEGVGVLIAEQDVKAVMAISDRTCVPTHKQCRLAIPALGDASEPTAQVSPSRISFIVR
jgi:ABC-type branched-subunit amino acid transport system ATPase component